jgi:hypothetical protein
MVSSARIKIPLAGLACLLLITPVRAGVVPAGALPIPNRVAAADAVVLGKVTSIEEKTVLVKEGTRMVEYKIAVVTVSDGLLGTKGAKTVRLGFVPIPPNVRINPAPLQPAVDMEGCFFLHASDNDFFTVRSQLDFINKSNEADVALVKRCTTLLATPDASLKAKDAEDRFFTASMLLGQYRTRRSANAKEEPIDAEQSKLILQALAGADWTPVNDFRKLSPVMVLGRIPLTEKDGWTPPDRKDAKAYAAYAQKWLNEHAATYRIQKYVVEKSK